MGRRDCEEGAASEQFQRFDYHFAIEKLETISNITIIIYNFDDFSKWINSALVIFPSVEWFSSNLTLLKRSSGFVEAFFVANCERLILHVFICDISEYNGHVDWLQMLL